MTFARVAASFGALLFPVLFPLAAIPAGAKPVVVISLSQAAVVAVANGTTQLAPLDAGTPIARGAVIRYTVRAKDVGAEPARRLALTGHIPAATAFVPGSLHGPGGHAEFSLDAKTFSAHPMVAVTAPDGASTLVPADPSRYVMVRWIKDGSLAAHSSTAFSYDVRLK